MREICCHQCKTVQSSARDVCMECGAFMMRKAENFVGNVNVSPPLPAFTPIPQPKPLIDPNKPPAYVDSGLDPDTPMICCHECYCVQLAEETVCTQCGKLMKRETAFMFPARQLTRPYHGRRPRHMSVKEDVSNQVTALMSTSTPPINFGNAVTPTLPSKALPTEAPSNKSSPSEDRLRICCHKCYAVQVAKNSLCEKCHVLMQREPQYLFEARNH